MNSKNPNGESDFVSGFRENAGPSEWIQRLTGSYGLILSLQGEGTVSIGGGRLPGFAETGSETQIPYPKHLDVPVVSFSAASPYRSCAGVAGSDSRSRRDSAASGGTGDCSQRAGGGAQTGVSSSGRMECACVSSGGKRRRARQQPDHE